MITSYTARCVCLYLCVLAAKIYILIYGLTQTGCSTTEYHNTINDKPYIARSVMLRGVGNIFSGGITATTNELRNHNIDAYALNQGDELSAYALSHRSKTPIILGGHSAGADDAIRTARRLHIIGVKVKLLVLIDPYVEYVIPPNIEILLLVHARPAYFVVTNNSLIVKQYDLRPIKIMFVDSVIGLFTHLIIDDNGIICSEILKLIQ